MTDPHEVIDPAVVEVVGFDADDTLWHSETFFAVTEDRFRALLAPWCAAEEVTSRFLDRERSNLALFGYGIKGFTLSMIETAIEASEGAIPIGAIQQIIDWGKEMLAHPVDLIDGVEATLDAVGARYRIVLLTKGDLFHQESKIAESGLADRFDAVEVMAEKDPATYRRFLDSIDVEPSSFLMIGNSARSDVLPIIEIGGQAIQVPYAITWGVEEVDGDASWPVMRSIGELAPLLGLSAPPADVGFG